MRLPIFFIALTSFLSSYSQSKWEVGLNFYESKSLELNQSSSMYTSCVKWSDSDVLPGLRVKRQFNKHKLRLGLEPSSLTFDRKGTQCGNEISIIRDHGLIQLNSLRSFVGWELSVYQNNRFSTYTGIDLNYSYGKAIGNYTFSGAFTETVEYNDTYRFGTLSYFIGTNIQINSLLSVSVESSLNLESYTISERFIPYLNGTGFNWTPFSALSLNIHL